MLISIGAEKALNKFQNPSRITLSKQGIKGNSLNLMEGIYKT